VYTVHMVSHQKQESKPLLDELLRTAGYPSK
jgi:hypothetical protein